MTTRATEPVRRARPARTRVGRVRWVVCGLLFCGMAVNYLDRTTLSTAMPFIQEDLGLDDAVTGAILGTFSITYAIFLLPMGAAADRFGPRITYAFAAVWWSIATALTAVAQGAASLTALRLLLGAGEAGSYPASIKAVAEWFPKGQRGRASGIFDSGGRVGAAIGLPLVTGIVAVAGWRMAFVATGALGLIWAAVWFWFYRRPHVHSWASPEEIELIDAGDGSVAEDQKRDRDDGPAVRWIDLFRYRTVWGMMAGFFCLNFLNYFFLTWLPSYLVRAKGFTLLELGFFGSIPVLASIVGAWAGGFTTDYLARRLGSVTIARKICLAGGSLVSSAIIGAAFVDSVGVALLLLSISYASLLFVSGSLWSLPADVAPTPKNVGSITGIQNSAGNIAGFLSPLTIGITLSLTGQFTVALYLMGAMSILGALCYIFLVGKAETLPIKGRIVGAGT